MQRTISDELATQLHELCNQGLVVEAARLFVEQTGGSITEAKHWIDQHRDGGRKESFPSDPAEDDAEIKALAGRGEMIEAIKRYRKLKNCSLREAKNQVEHFVETGDFQPDGLLSHSAWKDPVVKQKGCLGLALFIIVLITLHSWT